MLECQQAECFKSDGREFAADATGELQLVLDPEFLEGVLATQTLLAPKFRSSSWCAPSDYSKHRNPLRMNDVGTVFVLVGPKILKRPPDRPDHDCLSSISVQAAARCHRPGGISRQFPVRLNPDQGFKSLSVMNRIRTAGSLLPCS